MATGGEEKVGYSLAKVGTLKLEQTTDKSPRYTSIVVCQDKIVVLERETYKVNIHRLHDGKFLASDRLESRPRDMCLMDAMTICVLHWDGLIKMMSIDSTDMAHVFTTTRSLRLQGVLDGYDGVVRFNNNLVVTGERRGMMCWCIVSLQDGHVDTIHQICKVDRLFSESTVTTKDTIIYISCLAGGKFSNTGVYGFDILNPSQCKYTYKHQRLQGPRSIVINEDGNIFVCNDGYHDYCIHQLTASCQLVAIFTWGIPFSLQAIFWDNGRLYGTCVGSRDITVFQPVYQGSHKASEVLVSNERKQPVIEETAIQIRQGNVPVDQGQSSVPREMPPSGPVPEDSQDDKQGPVIPVEILRMDDKSLQLYKKALSNGKEKIYNIRVMVVGQFGVGKTTLTKRLLGKPVYISERKSTEGIDVYKHCCKISLDTGEWIVHHEDSDQLSRLQRLMKLLSGPDQKSDIRQEQEGHREVVYERETTPEADNAQMSEAASSSRSDQENQLTYSQPTKLSAIKKDGGHGMAHSDQGTSTVTVTKSEAESSNKEKKDAVIEILHLINENADKLEKDIVKYAALSIWDFAGRYAFYTTHQTFLSSRALYILVIDLNQQITDLIKDDKCFLDMEGIKLCKVHDLVEIWMNSIHTCASSPEASIPHVVLVGTHVDKLSEKSRKEVIDKYFKELRYILKDKPTIRHLMDDIAIDNTQRDPMLEILKRKIFELASQQPHWGEERPARWLPLEQKIMTLKASGAKVVARSLIEEINMSGSVRIEDSDELDLFLIFHHEMGTILYFSVEGLREKIVLDPQWLIDALKSLITAETFIKKYPAITSKWYEFEETGKLAHELIDAIWTEKNNQEFRENKDHILLLMEKLNIIARPRSFTEDGNIKESNYFLAPCMLQQKAPAEVICPKPNDQMGSSSVLCFVFIGNFMPSPIFHRLLAACVAHWPIATKNKEEKQENQIFCGCCVFELDSLHNLTLHFKEFIIFVRVTKMGIKDKTPSSKLCIEAREFINTNLLKIIGYLGQSLKFEYFIQCPEYSGESVNSLIPVSQLKENAEVRCKFHNNVIESCNLLKFWFEAKEQSGDVDALVPLEILRMDEKSKKLFKEALKKGEEKVYNVRVMVVGHCGVGKTTLINRLLGKQVNIQERCPTEGIDIHMHCCDVSMKTLKWEVQHTDSEEDALLLRLAKVVNEETQKAKVVEMTQQIQFQIKEHPTTEKHIEMISEHEKSPEIKKNKLQHVPQSTVGDVKQSQSQLARSMSIRSADTYVRRSVVDRESQIKEPKTEMLDLLCNRAHKLPGGEYAPLTILDFAGQYAFYTTHQTFLTRRAIYLLVSDVTQKADDLVKDGCYLDSRGEIECHVQDMTEVWMNSIHSCALSLEEGIPPVILVGTHVDKISPDCRHERFERYIENIRTFLSNKPSRFHLVNEEFAINNTVVDSRLEDLKRKIVEVASKQKYWGEKIPAQWLPLEQALMKLKAAKIKVITRRVVEDLPAANQISRDELDLFLTFHHDIGTILYFNIEILKEKIVLDPQWLIDALKSFINAKSFVLRNLPAVSDKWLEFSKTGRLSQQLIDAIWTEKNNQEFHDNKDHILLLMEKLNIIAKPSAFTEDGNKANVENYYLAPCMLRQETPKDVICPKPNPQMKTSSVLCYVFAEKFLPSPIFHRLLAACVARWPLATRKKENVQENQIFCGCGVFQLDQCHKLILHFREYVIFMRVTRMGIKEKTPSSEVCIGAREFITAMLSKIIGYLSQNLRYEQHIQCPEYSGVSVNSLIPVSLLEKNAEVRCDFHDNMIEPCSLLKFWFKDQEQSADVNSSKVKKTNREAEHQISETLSSSQGKRIRMSALKGPLTDPELLCQILKKSTEVDSSSRRTLEENCQIMGLKFHGETLGNGNCFFEAVSSQLQRLNCAVQKSPQQLRLDVVAFMKANTILQVSEGIINLAEFISNGNFNDYCERMAQDGEWADHVVVVGMARMLQKDIMIVTSAPSSGPDNIIAWVVGQTSFNGEPILLGHIWENHYQSLQPVGSDDRKQLLTAETSAKMEQVIQTNDPVEQICSRISLLNAPEKHKLLLPPGKKYHVFFSYASPDIQWVKETVKRLENNHGFVCCEYDRDNTPGTLLLSFAADGIKYAIKTVVVMTKDAFKSGYVELEIQMALQQRCETGRKCVVPVLVQDCTIPDYLRILNYVDARDPSQIDIWWPKLLIELQTQDNAQEDLESNQGTQYLSEEPSTQLEQGDSKEEQQQLYRTTESGTWV